MARAASGSDVGTPSPVTTGAEIEVWARITAAPERAPQASVVGRTLPWRPTFTGPATLASSFHVRALTVRIGSDWAGHQPDLTPSNWTPYEPPELPDPRPLVRPDTMVELLNEMLISPEGQPVDARVEYERGMLRVRHSSAGLAQVPSFLSALSAHASRRTNLDVVLMHVPEGEALPTSRGLARADLPNWPVAHRGRLVCAPGVRRVLDRTRQRAYLADYEVEIAEDAVIANPVMAKATSGFVFDVSASPSLGGGDVHLDYRAWTSEVEMPLRTTQTPHGTLDTPDQRCWRAAGGAVIADDGYTALATFTHDGERMVLFVAPHFVQEGN